MAHRESITFLGQEYQSGEPDSDGIDAVYSSGDAKIEMWQWNGEWEASLCFDDESSVIRNHRTSKPILTEEEALRDLETNARKFLRALGVEI